MENRCHVLLLVIALVAAVNSQSYPRFEFRGVVLVNNSYILWPNIGEGHNDSLHCVTDNLKVTGMIGQEKSSRDQIETIVCMSLEEMEWSISTIEQGEDQECGDVIFLIVMVYSRASTSTLAPI